MGLIVIQFFFVGIWLLIFARLLTQRPLSSPDLEILHLVLHRTILLRTPSPSSSISCPLPSVHCPRPAWWSVPGPHLGSGPLNNSSSGNGKSYVWVDLCCQSTIYPVDLILFNKINFDQFSSY